MVKLHKVEAKFSPFMGEPECELETFTWSEDVCNTEPVYNILPEGDTENHQSWVQGCVPCLSIVPHLYDRGDVDLMDYLEEGIVEDMDTLIKFLREEL